MAVCVRCITKVSFLGGVSTFKGRYCEKCHEIEKLSEKLEGVLKQDSVIKKFRALRPELMPDVLRLSELDAENQKDLRIAVGCFQIASSQPVSEESLRAPALSALFKENEKPEYLLKLIEAGAADSAAELMAESRRVIGDEWMNVISALNTSGQRERALSLALGLQGIRNREVSELVLSLATPQDLAALQKWIASGRFVSLENMADFLRKSRAHFGDLLLDSASAKLSGAERVKLLAMLGEKEKLAEMFAAVPDADSDLLAAAERLVKEGDGEIILGWLTRIAAPGPLAEKICSLATQTGEKDRALAIMIQCEEWKRAEQFVPDRDVRALCRKKMGENERDFAPRILRAVDLVFKNEPRQAHILLTSIIETAAGRAPVAALAAMALDALLCSVELDTALSLSGAFEVIATRRRIRKALADEGTTGRSIETLREMLIAKCRRFFKADGSPFFLLLGPGVPDEKAYSRARELDAARDQRFHDAAEAKDASDISERALLEPTLIRNFGDALIALGDRAYERATLYGLLAKRLLAPIREERTGPKELAIEAAARAIAFMPKVAATSENKWGDFIFTFSGALTHLGYESHGITRQQQVWPCWIDEAQKVPQEGITLGATDHLPPLDGSNAMTLADFYKPPAEIAPSKERKLWEK